MLWDITRFALNGKADFDNENLRFILPKAVNYGDSIPSGTYTLTKDTVDAHRYRIGHPLAQKLISEYKNSKPSEARTLVAP